MDKSRRDERTETEFAKEAESEATGAKASRTEKLDLDYCKRQIVDILRHREGIDVQIRRTILRREKMSQLDDFTEIIHTSYKQVVERLSALNPEFFSQEFEEARQALILEVTKKLEEVIDVRGEIGWTRRMLADTETILKMKKTQYEAVYSCLSDTLALIAPSFEEDIINCYQLPGKRRI